MGLKSRRKGAGAEIELCALLNNHLGTALKRKLGQARDSGNDVDLPPFKVECKRYKRIGKVYEWMEQATEACEVGDVPIVACRADGERWLVVMGLDDWVKLAREEVSQS